MKPLFQHIIHGEEEQTDGDPNQEGDHSPPAHKGRVARDQKEKEDGRGYDHREPAHPESPRDTVGAWQFRPGIAKANQTHGGYEPREDKSGCREAGQGIDEAVTQQRSQEGQPQANIQAIDRNTVFILFGQDGRHQVFPTHGHQKIR